MMEPLFVMDAEWFGEFAKLTFSMLVSEYLMHHSHRELADYVECIPSTVLRWASGTATPMRGVQKMIIKHINEVRHKEGW